MTDIRGGVIDKKDKGLEGGGGHALFNPYPDPKM